MFHQSLVELTHSHLLQKELGCAALPPSKYMKITNGLHSQRQFEGLESRVHIQSAVVIILPMIHDYQCHTIMVGEGNAS